MANPERLEALQQREKKFLFDMTALVDLATKESRGLTDGEKTEYASLEKGLGDVGAQIAGLERTDKRRVDSEAFHAELDRITGGQGGERDARILVGRFGTRKTFGQQFVESEAFAWLGKNRDKRTGQWTSDGVEIERKALTEDPASGGALVVPDYQRTIQGGPTPSVVVADLCAPGTTTSNVVPVMVESAFTNAAAPVLEGGAKPESSLTFAPQSEPVRKLAHWIPVSEELLEDAPAVASYVDARLRYGVLRKEDQQLLSGTGVAPELLGFLARAGLAADVALTAPQTNADAILAQIVAIETATGLAVSGVVMNPVNWAAVIGSKLTTGEYLAGGPFGSPTAPMIWNRPVALTNQIAAGTALVGAFKTGAQVFRHGGIRVATTNAHSDFFVKNLVAIRAEERLALAVYRSAAFGKVTGLT